MTESSMTLHGPMTASSPMTVFPRSIVPGSRRAPGATRTDGSTAYQYCDITVVEPTEEQQTADSTQTDETAPVSPDAAAAE